MTTLAARSVSAHVADYWTSVLADPPAPLDLPTGSPSLPDDRIGATPVTIDADTAARLSEVARTHGSELYTAVLAAWCVLLARLTGRRDLLIAARPPAAGGQPVLVRSTMSESSDFTEVVQQFDAVVRAAAEHAIAPAQLRAAGLLGDDVRAQAAFDLTTREDAPRETDETGPLLVLRPAGGPDGGMCGSLISRLDDRTAGRYADMITHLVRELANAPGRPALKHSPVPPAERSRILTGLNRYRTPSIPHTTMAQPFEEQVRRTPDAEAVVGDEGTLTYAELNVSANRLGWRLRELGAGPGALVAVSMRAGLPLMVALYAVAKTGAAYVPIDPGLPDARMRFMLEDSAPVAVLADESTRARLDAATCPLVAVDVEAEQWADRPTHDLPAEDGNHLIHMLYTSGTTGRPKAVAYPVDGALADIGWLHQRYPYRAGDTALFKTSYGFDVSIWEIFWPLYTGARVVVAPSAVQSDPALLRDIIDRHRVTAMFMVPSLMHPFFGVTTAGSCPSVRHVFCGGEAVTPRVRDGFHERFSARLLNCYGPTELGCVAETVLAVDPGAAVPVGRPPEHRRIYVLDDTLQPAPIGTPGELYVGGDVGIAQNYHRRAPLTAERFLADPFGPIGGRMYRTGDLVRLRDDGVLEHLGRIGRQVKIRGVRIELAEIEAVLAEHGAVDRCVVTVAPDRDDEIAAFVTAAAGEQLSVPAVLAHARRNLPRHMVPATITAVDSIPMLVNGKIDMEQLLGRIERDVSNEAAPFVAPATDVEATVAGFFGQILQRETVSATAAFFDLGGHSLQVFRLMELCTERYGIQLSVRQVLRDLTPRGIAALVEPALPRGDAP